MLKILAYLGSSCEVPLSWCFQIRKYAAFFKQVDMMLSIHIFALLYAPLLSAAIHCVIIILGKLYDHFSVSLVVFNTQQLLTATSGSNMLLRRWYDGGYYARNVQLTSANCSSLNLIRIRIVPCGGFHSTPEEVLSFTFTMLVSRSKIAQLPNVDSNHTCPEAWLNCIQSFHRSWLAIVYARAKSVIDSFNMFQWKGSFHDVSKTH